MADSHPSADAANGGGQSGGQITGGFGSKTGNNSIHGILRERKNWLINMLYVRHEFDECKTVIEDQLKDCDFKLKLLIFG